MNQHDRGILPHDGGQSRTPEGNAAEFPAGMSSPHKEISISKCAFALPVLSVTFPGSSSLMEVSEVLRQNNVPRNSNCRIFHSFVSCFNYPTASQVKRAFLHRCVKSELSRTWNFILGKQMKITVTSTRQTEGLYLHSRPGLAQVPSGLFFLMWPSIYTLWFWEVQLMCVCVCVSACVCVSTYPPCRRRQE